jgi:hypothetical protein
LIIDISGDGSTLAIRSDISIWALKWNDTHYTQHFNSLPSGEASAVSLSRDGNAMAAGIPSSRGGVTTVYKVRPAGCMGNTKLLRISFTTDYFPEQNRWTLHIGNETIESQPYDGLPLTTFVKEICVPNDVCIKFRVYDSIVDQDVGGLFDSGGDGIQDPGGYSVMLDGKEVANGDDFRFKEGGDLRFGETKYITGDCNCPAGLSLLSIVASDSKFLEIQMRWALSYQNNTSAGEYAFIRTMNHTVEIFEECIPEGCWHLSNPQCHERWFTDDLVDYMYGNWWYNITYNGLSEIKSSEGTEYFCPQGNETISFGECLPGENVTVKYVTPTMSPTASISPTCSNNTPGCFELGIPYPTYPPTISISPSSSSSPTLCTGNTPDWVDGEGYGCGSYEELDFPGCPKYGSDPYWIGDMGSASENCCYCRFQVANNSTPSPSITYSAFPTASTLQTKPPTKPSFLTKLTKFDELTTATENNEDGTN